MSAKLFHMISKIYCKVFGQDFESFPANTESCHHEENPEVQLPAAGEVMECKIQRAPGGRGFLMPGIDIRIAKDEQCPIIAEFVKKGKALQKLPMQVYL